jgi:CheY-like chemotaxis protein
MVAMAALVVGADDDARRVLRSLLQEMDVSVESSADMAAARLRLQRAHFDAVFIDCQIEDQARDLISDLRDSALNRNSLAVAVVDHSNYVRDILAEGVGFVLYKPISRQRTTNSLRAARDLVRNERRVFPRIPIAAGAEVDYAGAPPTSAPLLDLSEDGIAFRSERSLAPCCKVYFQFSLPGNVSVVRLSGEVMWQDSQGRVGLRFEHVPATSRRILQDWLKTAQLAADGKKISPGADTAAHRLSASLELLAQASPDRRDPTRRSCSLGAEVYLAGSNVPHRCVISDVSKSGCYIESTIPFAVGTALDIGLRAGELKFSLPGMVRKMDPGFGMGVKFCPTSDTQVKHINTLLDRLSSAPKFTR